MVGPLWSGAFEWPDDDDAPRSIERRPTALLPRDTTPATGAARGSDGVLAERYLLIEPIGQGGTSTVWKARDLRDASLVAIKMMAPNAAGGRRLLERFRREITLASRLAGPSYVRVVDSGEVDGRAYLVMELLQGESLQERLSRLGRLGHGELLLLSTGLRNALSSAHALDVVHRDIKPGNIFFAKRGRGEGSGDVVKLLDLGIAKDSFEGARLTATGTFLGTPHYMSPEQVNAGREVDAKADLWSTAVVLYQALTGVLPFVGSAPQATLGIATSSFAPPSLVMGISQPALDAFFSKAFSSQIRRRFASIEALHEAFAAALGGAGTRTGSTLPGVASRFDATRTTVGEAGYAELAVCVTRNDAAAREPAVEVVAAPLQSSSARVARPDGSPLPALDDVPLAAALWKRTRDLVNAVGAEPSSTRDARAMLVVACLYVVVAALATAAACLLPRPTSRRARRSRGAAGRSDVATEYDLAPLPRAVAAAARGASRAGLRTWTRT